MTKIVYNACYGGFGLSRKAIERYHELNGQQVWIEPDEKMSTLDIYTVWLVSPENRVKPLPGYWGDHSMEDRIRYNEEYSKQTWSHYDLDRADPILVQVVEELGKAANARSADLKIRELAKGTIYRIDEYDGNENVVTQDEYEWSVA
jgi:hypothetical protein